MPTSFPQVVLSKDDGTTYELSGLATSSGQSSVTGSKAAGTAATSSVLTGAVYNATAPTLTDGQQAASQADATGALRSAPSVDQDPIFDHTNGTKTSVTTSATILTPPAGCKYARISTDVDAFVNTAGNAAVDDGTSIRIVANQPEIIPVVAATAVKALSSSGTATIRCTPLKVR